ncbi:MAG: carboxypeptidase-like regulatory domain-containing protein [Firmicutes bacterium]|nr:carboxypeptidase-like regulatory domain-containing protein [Bacillota bacterium]
MVKIPVFWYIAKTNSNGYYILYVLKNGNPYELVFQAPNYITSKPEWYSTVNVQEGDKLNINMGLKKLPQQKLRIVLHMPKKERYEINNDFNAYIWLPYGKSLHDDYHSLGSGSTDNVYTHRYGSTEVYTDIFQWDPGKYTFAVKRFNTDTPFFSTGCWVEIFDQNGIQIGNNISPPNSSPNDLWWHVLDINVQNETPQIDIINQMLENTPR